MTQKDKELMEKIDQWAVLHRKELIEDIIQLINIKSVSMPGEGGYAMGKGCKECLDLFPQMGEKYGFATDNDDDFCASILYQGERKEELAILGHLDVVPEGEGWQYDPYQAFEKDGYIVGRGSLDNKGPLVTALYVLRCLKDLDIRLQHTVRVIGGTDEENGMKDVEHYLQTHIPPIWTLVCDAVWVLCNGEMGILTAQLSQEIEDGNLIELCGGVAVNSVPARASAVIKEPEQKKTQKLLREHPEIRAEWRDKELFLEVYGKAAHAAFPQNGENAIYKLLDMLCRYQLLRGDAAGKIKALRMCFTDDFGTGLNIAFEDEVSGKTVCTGGMISFKDHKLVQTINVRFAIEQDKQKLVRALKDSCMERGIRLEKLDTSAPRYISKEDPKVKLLVDTCYEFLGDQVNNGVFVMGGGTHARKFPNAVPTGCYIPQKDSPFGVSHGIHEAAYVDSFLLAIRIYVFMLLRLDGYFTSIEDK